MAAEQIQDQTRYCERCGISFLWSREEQKAARAATAPPPLLCPGCRVLVPEAGRERGLVKWFNYRKRFGFIVRTDQAEIFVHGSDVRSNTKLVPGDLVEFSVEKSERGPVAKEIQVLAHGDAPVA